MTYLLILLPLTTNIKDYPSNTANTKEYSICLKITNPIYQFIAFVASHVKFVFNFIVYNKVKIV